MTKHTPADPCGGNEANLWMAVVNRAAQDLMLVPGLVKGTATPEWHHLEDAIKWFCRNSADFNFACHAAGLSPSYVRRKALSIITKRYSFHVDAGHEALGLQAKLHYRVAATIETELALTCPERWSMVPRTAGEAS